MSGCLRNALCPRCSPNSIATTRICLTSFAPPVGARAGLTPAPLKLALDCLTHEVGAVLAFFKNLRDLLKRAARKTRMHLLGPFGCGLRAGGCWGSLKGNWHAMRQRRHHDGGQCRAQLPFPLTEFSVLRFVRSSQKFVHVRRNTGITGCCARAASGHAAAPPSSVMNSRRLTRSPRRRGQAASAALGDRAPWPSLS